MSWSVEVTGDSDDIAAAFDKERASCAAYGMIEAEQQDINDARDFAGGFAAQYGQRFRVSASGHWNITSESKTFGRVSVTIEKVASPEPPSSPSA